MTLFLLDPHRDDGPNLIRTGQTNGWQRRGQTRSSVE